MGVYGTGVMFKNCIMVFFGGQSSRTNHFPNLEIDWKIILERILKIFKKKAWT